MTRVVLTKMSLGVKGGGGGGGGEGDVKSLQESALPLEDQVFFFFF